GLLGRRPLDDGGGAALTPQSCGAGPGAQSLPTRPRAGDPTRPAARDLGLCPGATVNTPAGRLGGADRPRGYLRGGLAPALTHQQPVAAVAPERVGSRPRAVRPAVPRLSGTHRACRC